MTVSIVVELLLLTALGAAALALLFSRAPTLNQHNPGSDRRPQKSTSVAPAVPQSRVEISMPRLEGRILSVSRDSELQAALDEARPGDEVDLKAGVAFHGNFVLPPKVGSSAPTAPKWIIITSSRSPTDSIPATTRLSPAAAGRLAKIISPNGEPALRAAAGAGYYRLVAIEMTIAPSVKINYGILRLGEGTESSVDQLPHHIIVDRCYIHGQPTSNVRRGIGLNSAASAVVHSRISDCHEAGADSQAICGWNGTGPFEISDNYLEAAGENVMFGGADPAIPGLIPSDITFTRNYCCKSLAWRASTSQRPEARWSVKNLFELKNADRVLIESNVFDNNWVDAQTGYAILFKSVNQDGKAPWSVTRNVIFRGNLVRHASSCINIAGRDSDHESGRTSLVLIENNRFEDIDSNRWGGEGVFIKISGAQDVHVDHNTALGTGSIIVAYGEATERFSFVQNAVCHNAYGIKGDGTSSGTPTLLRFFPGYVVSGNAIMGGNASLYPPGNCFPPCRGIVGSQATVVQANGCPAVDGKSPGCDLEVSSLLEAAGAAGVDGR